VEVGGYRAIELLGEGAAGAVYRATDGPREVALKVLRAADEESQRRFAREARIAQGIESQHVVRVLAVGPDYLVMPLYASTLAREIRASGRLTLERTVALAAELAEGLDALHARQILHRDVKPSNVLVDASGTAALADFGLARGADSTQLTRDGQLVGTTHYLAPELIEGASASPASDLYAFGCVLFECLTGAPPFTGRDDAEIGYAHLVEPPPDVRSRRADLSGDVALALLSALAKQPASRPTTAHALARMLHLARTPSPARSTV
jgi:eukaryotic-like serine/threonine-protein kinase